MERHLTMWEFLPAALTIAGSITSYMGNQKSADAAMQTGQRQATAAQYQAAQLEQNAGQAIAASQLQSAEQQRQARLLASRALAVSAASGGGATDPTITHIIANIAGEGAYRGALALYQGEDKARMLRMEAEGKRYEAGMAIDSANARASSYRTAATASLLSGAGSLFGKYGMGGFNSAGKTTVSDAGGVLDAGTPNFTMAG